MAASLLLAAALAGPPAANAQFRVIETDHLRLVYHGSTLQYIAPYTAQCFENAFNFHRRMFSFEPSEKINVLLDDFTDFGNAGVWVTPRNSMVLHIAPCSFVYETGPSNERVNFTMNHELMHVVALDQAAGSDHLFRTLFHGKVRPTGEHPETILYGYLTLPRRDAPRWYHEGIAVFMETWMAGGIGRAQGPYDEMVFRSMVCDSAHIYDPLGLEAEGTKVDFQVGVNSYLYGTRFMTYLAWQYSPEKVLEWVSRRPGSHKYFANQFESVFGRSLHQGWRDWIDWERQFQRANLDSIRRYPTTSYRDLSRRALGSVSRAYLDSTNRTLYAGVFYPGTVAHIAAIPLDGHPPRVVKEMKGPALYFVTSLAWDPDRRLLYYTTDNNDWRDLCSLDPATGKTKLLIKDARVGDLAFDRADRSLWGIRHFNGISTLVRLAPPYDNWTQIWSLPYGQDLYDLDISNDGRSMVASHAEISGRQTLRLFRPDSLALGDTSSVVLHDFGTAIPTSFVFSADGRRLYGSSYYTGVSNIFRYDFDADSMDVVTNCETGMFRPIPLGGDSLIVFRYTGQGFVPAAIQARPLSDVSATTYLGNELVLKHPEVKSWKVPSPRTVRLDSLGFTTHKYKALESIRPTTIYPIVEAYKDRTAVGLQMNLSDPITMHGSNLSLSYTADEDLPEDERWHAKFGYMRYNLRATAKYNAASFYDLFGPTKTSRKGYSAGLNYSRSLIHDDPQSLDLTVRVDGYGGLERLPDAQNVSTTPGVDKLLNGGIDLGYRNLRSSIGASDTEKGFTWSLTAEDNGVRFVQGSDAAWRGFPQFSGAFDVGMPFVLRNSSLWLRTNAGYSPGDRFEPFANFFFGGFGNNWIDGKDPKRYRSESSFPGVEIDAIGGTNYTRGMVEVNLPALRFERLGTLAFYASWLRVSVFGTGIVTNLDDDETRRRVGNVGAQADVRFALLTQQPLTFSVGYARAFERHFATLHEWMASLKIL